MIRQRQLNMREPPEPVDFGKMKVGLRTINDATVDLNTHKLVNPNYGNKRYILERINKRDYNRVREISNYFYDVSGIYQRLCRYLAFLYRYDWYVSPFIINIDKVNENKVLNDFSKVLTFLDNSNVKRLCGDIALEIMKNGVYYGCLVIGDDNFSIQQLPARYCRNRYFQGSVPIVELNMQFFDAQFRNPQYRLKVLSMFPKDIQRAYVLYKQNKLPSDFPEDAKGWYALDPEVSVKFSLNNNEFPPLIGVIPSIIDLDEAQELDRRKTMQKLLKILVQKLPLDKNGDLIFDIDEAKDIHNNAVAMLDKAVGMEVLTTFADIISINTKDNDSATSKDDLEKVERTVFNNSGISRNLFNAEGNLAVTNSILNDESNVRDLILQFQTLLNRVVSQFDRKNHYTFKVNILETTQYNYKELSKMYKEQVQLGYSKMLPQIALGHSQSSILATVQFENEVLHLSEIMMPPLSSNTVNGSTILDKTKQVNNKEEKKENGRPEKADNEKSDKTIANRESMN